MSQGDQMLLENFRLDWAKHAHKIEALKDVTP